MIRFLLVLFLLAYCSPDLFNSTWIRVPYDDGTSYFHNRLTRKSLDCLL
jgi:hypothetical protein